MSPVVAQQVSAGRLDALTDGGLAQPRPTALVAVARDTHAVIARLPRLAATEALVDTHAAAALLTEGTHDAVTRSDTIAAVADQADATHNISAQQIDASTARGADQSVGAKIVETTVTHAHAAVADLADGAQHVALIVKAVHTNTRH
jgi:hypothetical protein